MLIKNIAPAGRGLGVKGHGNITWAPGEIKDVDAAVIAEAMKDPANAATLTEEGGLVEAPKAVAAEVAKIDADAAAAQAKADAEKAAAAMALKAAEDAAKNTAPTTTAATGETPAKPESKKGASK